MSDDAPIREYLVRRLHEARTIHADSAVVVSELEDVLAHGDPGTLEPLRLDAWVDQRRTALEHIGIELYVLAGAQLGTPWWARWLRCFQKRLP